MSDIHLLHIHGRTTLSTYATQVSLKASSLNTNDCFILVNPEKNWIWLGKGATEDEKELAQNIGKGLNSHDSIVFDEGQENDEFWSVLGGKEPYLDQYVLKNVGEPTMPRLFHGSNASGSFKSMMFYLRLLDT